MKHISQRKCQECNSEHCIQIERTSPSWVGGSFLIILTFFIMILILFFPEQVSASKSVSLPEKVFIISINILGISVAFLCLAKRPIFEKISATETKICFEHRFVIPYRERFKELRIIDISKIVLVKDVWFLTIHFKENSKNRFLETFCYRKNVLLPFVEALSRNIKIERE